MVWSCVCSKPSPGSIPTSCVRSGRSLNTLGLAFMEASLHSSRTRFSSSKDTSMRSYLTSMHACPHSSPMQRCNTSIHIILITTCSYKYLQFMKSLEPPGLDIMESSEQCILCTICPTPFPARPLSHPHPYSSLTGLFRYSVLLS